MLYTVVIPDTHKNSLILDHWYIHIFDLRCKFGTLIFNNFTKKINYWIKLYNVKNILFSKLKSVNS